MVVVGFRCVKVMVLVTCGCWVAVEHIEVQASCSTSRSHAHVATTKRSHDAIFVDCSNF